MKLDLKKLKIGEEKNTPTRSYAEENNRIHSSKELGQIVQKKRKKIKKTQEEVAVFSNLSRLAISELENGKSDLKISTLLKVLKACDLELVIREKA